MATADRSRQILLIAVAATVLGVASTVALAAAGPNGPNGLALDAPVRCEVPALPGTVVNVTLVDMPGAMAGRGMMGPVWHGQAGPGARMYESPRGMRMMSIPVDPTYVPSGQVSFRVVNAGAWVHELAVLPMSLGHNVGQRPIGAGNQVDESAALGHAARTCATGEGDGIVPRGIGWMTTTLAPGRYELICNVAGHYWAGMYTELTVVG